MPRRESELTVTRTITIPLSELMITAVRSSGPGGQNVNKVNSQIQLRWDLRQTTSLPEGVRERFLAQQRRRINREGVFQLTSQRFRDQQRNRQDCLDRLVEIVRSATVVPKTRKKTKVPRRARETRLKDKRARSTTKQNRRPPSME